MLLESIEKRIVRNLKVLSQVVDPDFTPCR